MKPILAPVLVLGVLLGLGYAVWSGTVFFAHVVETPPAGPSIRANEQGTAIDVVGLTPERQALFRSENLTDETWAEVFSVRVASDKVGAADRPAMLGTYSFVNGVLRFRPRFPLARGTRYQVEFNPAAGSLTLGKEFGPRSTVRTTVLLPKPPRGEPTSLAQVYPTADSLPENLLRFYLHFSAPMSCGGVYRYIHLLGPDGKEVDLPFLELDEELWDARRQRFTLLIDPGRIKRGLKPREDVGPALVAGGRYTLVVDADWPDADGEPLKAAYRKTFAVAAPVEAAVDPKDCKLEAPTAGGRSPLVLTFPRPLDHALLLRMFAVVGPDGKEVKGAPAVRQSETRWEFTPEGNWAAGEHQLVVDTRLEDVCGNRVGKPFEVDEFHPVEREMKAEKVTLPFRVGGAK